MHFSKRPSLPRNRFPIVGTLSSGGNNYADLSCFLVVGDVTDAVLLASRELDILAGNENSVLLVEFRFLAKDHITPPRRGLRFPNSPTRARIDGRITRDTPPRGARERLYALPSFRGFFAVPGVWCLYDLMYVMSLYSLSGFGFLSDTK